MNVESKKLEVRKMIVYTYEYYTSFYGIPARRLYLQSSKGWFGTDSVRNTLCSMGTLWMIDSPKEFERAEAYVMEKLDFSKLNDEIIVSQVTTDYLGSLLSVYALTQRQWYLDKAKELADILQKAYDSLSGLPYWKINLKTKAVDGFIVSLSECYNGALEYNYLSSLTRDEQYKARINTIRKLLKETKWPRGCHISRMNIETGKIWGSQAQLFNGTRDFYFTLVKEWYQSGKSDQEAHGMYREAMEQLIKPSSFVVMTSRTGQKFLQCYDPFTKKDEKQMWYDGCYVGAMWSLAAQMLEMPTEDGGQVYEEQAKKQMDLAISVTETCIRSHQVTETKLAPRKFLFNNRMDGDNIEFGPIDKQHHLTPEMSETYFIMWRLTHDEQYRTYAWEMAQAFQDHCRSLEKSGGFSSIKRVDATPTEKIKIYPPHWISGTLKFLYLIFCDDTVYSLDEWVFSATGQLLPIRGRHPTYPVLPTTDGGAGANNIEHVAI